MMPTLRVILITFSWIPRLNKKHKTHFCIQKPYVLFAELFLWRLLHSSYSKIFNISIFRKAATTFLRLLASSSIRKSNTFQIFKASTDISTLKLSWQIVITIFTSHIFLMKTYGIAYLTVFITRFSANSVVRSPNAFQIIQTRSSIAALKFGWF